jgi:NAD(P)-dependent dehydrogenase (short-subunit alcohol dehydrogenase family)
MSRRWLITGVSSGLGAALARAVLDQGDAVLGTVRGPAAAADFSALAPGRSESIVLDVTDRQAVFAALQNQEVDVLVNNAGYCLAGAVESLEAEDLRAQLETNVVGALNLIQAVLPGMRASGQGRILNIGSLSGAMGMAGLGAYCASKFAMAGLSDTLASEVRRFGIFVTLVEPGGFRTDFAGRSLQLGRRSAPAYDELHAAMQTGFARSNGAQPNDPAKGARALIRLAEQPAPPVRFAIGHDAVQRLKAALSDRIDGYAESLTFGVDTAFD